MARPLDAGIVPLRVDATQIVRLSDPDPVSVPCPAAKELAAYAAGLIDPLEQHQHPPGERIVRALFLIQARYFRLFERAPAAHRKQRQGRHVCLHQTFERSHARLMALWDHEQEYRLARPPKPLPPPAPAPAPEPPRPRSVAEALAGVFGA